MKNKGRANLQGTNQGHLDAFDPQHLLQRLAGHRYKKQEAIPQLSLRRPRKHDKKNCTCFIKFCICVHSAVAHRSLKFFLTEFSFHLTIICI